MDDSEETQKGPSAAAETRNEPVGRTTSKAGIHTLTPLAEPQYVTHAKLDQGRTIFQLTGKSRKYISQKAGVHGNTGSPIIDGRRATYALVHRVFSAINMILDNRFRRIDYVLYYNDNDAVKDVAFEQCLVFPGLQEYMKSLGATSKSVGDAARVRTFYVDHMIEGRPVSENLVRAVFEVLNDQMAGKLNESAELIN
jgi:hypothetical protein